MKRTHAIILAAAVGCLLLIVGGVMIATAADDQTTATSAATGLVSGPDYQKATSDATGVVGSGGATWPSSYTNGPLGSNEILPNSNGGVLLGLWSGVQGNSATQNRDFVEQRITDMGRSPDLLGASCDLPCTTGYDVSGSDLFEGWAHSLGAIPLMDIGIPGTTGSSVDYASVAAGTEDSLIDDFAAREAAFGHRVMVRLFEELGHTGHGTWNTTDFINAWRHVVNRIRVHDGATNVGFYFNPDQFADSSSQDYINVANSYPGDAYVDWVGPDQYNWDTTTSYCNPNGPNWCEFKDLFDFTCSGCTTSYAEWAGTKPFFIWETGTKYDTANVPSGHTVVTTRKADWYRNIVTNAIPNMPNMIGIDFFDQDLHTDAPCDNWRFDNNQYGFNTDNCPTHGSFDQTSYNGFLDMSAASAFNVGAAGGTS